MSLLLGRRVWIVLLTYCLFFSCKIKTGDNEVSGLVQPDGERQSTFYRDDFKLETSTVLYNTINSNVSQRLLVGQYVDAVFGTVTADAYAQFVLSNSFLTFGPDPVLDSTLLIVSFSSTSPLTTPYSYGDILLKPDRISIHRLLQSIIDTSYLTSSQIPYDPNPLGQELQLDGNHTVLNNSLGQEFIDGVSNFSSSDVFKTMFKGIALVYNSGSSIRGIENMRILLKFHNYYGLNNLVVNDSLSIYLNGSPRFSFSNIKLDLGASTKLSSLQNEYNEIPSQETQDTCYIQSNTGIGTKIKFPFIDSLRKTLNGKILIDRADLVIKPADVSKNLDGTSSLPPPPPYLMAYELDSLGHVQTITTAAGISVFLQSETSAGILGSSRPLVVQYDLTNEEYRVTMTSYIQALIDKNVNKPNYGLLFIGSNDIQAANNTNYYYSNINTLKFKSSDIKLQVHYSEYK